MRVESELKCLRIVSDGGLGVTVLRNFGFCYQIVYVWLVIRSYEQEKVG